MNIKAGIWPTEDDRTAGLWKRAGLTGFAFFLIKGLLWLVAPIVFYLFGG